MQVTGSVAWQETYAELVRFVARDPDVVIAEASVSIPEASRPGFYELFDRTRFSFLAGFDELLLQADALSRRYRATEAEVSERLKLRRVGMSPALQVFLHDPRQGLARGLFDPLFSLLSGRLTLEEFERGTADRVRRDFAELFRLGFEKLVEIALVRALEPDLLLRVPVHEPTSKEIIKRSDVPQPVPIPLESADMLLTHDPYPILAVPEVIVRSAAVGRYVGLGTEFRGAFWSASNPSPRREWLEVAEPGGFSANLILVYVGDDPEEIALLADRDRICRPDLIVECRDGSAGEPHDLANATRHQAALRPRLGSFVLCPGLAAPEVNPIVDRLRQL